MDEQIAKWVKLFGSKLNRYFYENSNRISRRYIYKDRLQYYKEWNPKNDAEVVDGLHDIHATLQEYFYNKERDAELGKCWIPPMGTMPSSKSNNK